jgi:tetratricopeptide (TPR) repeat protein
MTLALSQRRACDFDAAIMTFRAAAALTPKGAALANIARALYFAERDEEAEAAANEALAAGAEAFEAHRTLGELYANQGRFEDAIAAIDRAMKVAPPEAIATTELTRGHVLFELGRDDEARAAWLAAEKAGSSEARNERHSRFPPETGADFYGEASIWVDREDWQSARAPLERAANLFRQAMRAPGDFAARQLATVLTTLGNVLRQMHDVDGAIRALEEACRVRPTGFEPLVMLANVVANVRSAPGATVTVEGAVLDSAAGRRKKALELFDRGVALAHGTPNAHYNRGLVLMASRRAREAVADFEKALAYSDPSKRYDAQFTIVKALWKAGAFEDARKKCDELWGGEAGKAMTRNNIAGLLLGEPAHQANRSSRLARTLAVLLESRSEAHAANPGKYPFRFYGIRPADWRKGTDVEHEYRLRFRDAPDAARREQIAIAVTRPWTSSTTARPSGPGRALSRRSASANA